MGTRISKQTRRKLLEALRERYANASKIENTKILDEFIDIAGCHRKHAIRLLMGVDPVTPDAPGLGRTISSGAVREALVVLWEAADRICGKRLKAILPGLISAMERHGHLALYIGLAAWGWGGWSAFLAHPARAGAVVAMGVIAVAAMFTSGNLPFLLCCSCSPHHAPVLARPL
jgi:hypothetical protein